MHFAIAERAALLAAPHLKQAWRSTSKIAVAVAPEVLQKLTQNELKARQHPGLSKHNRIELPPQVERALVGAIGDFPVKPLQRDCRQLDKYINGRHPPPEEDELQARVQSIAAEIEAAQPPPTEEEFAAFSDTQALQWQRRREHLLRRRMSQRTYAWKPITYGTYEALVYALGRSAKEYAVLVRILQELTTRDPNFQPRSYFDFGAGVGSGMWAASLFWRPSIFEYFNVDSSREMHELSELVLRGGNANQEPFLRNVYFRQFLPGIETQYDLVVCAYSLFELPSAERRQEVLLNLWRKCSQYLVIVEEGTRRGSQLVNEARDYILNSTPEQSDDLLGHVFSPCAQSGACPRLTAEGAEQAPCNFEASYAPVRLGSDAHVDRLTARYSYVVLRKGAPSDATQDWPRLVRPTLVRSGHVICRMCTAEGKLQEIIFTQAKHGRPAYRCAKASRWGDRLPIAIGEPIEVETRKDKILERIRNAAQARDVELAAPFTTGGDAEK